MQKLVGILGENCYFEFALESFSGNHLSGPVQHTECNAQGAGVIHRMLCCLEGFFSPLGKLEDVY